MQKAGERVKKERFGVKKARLRVKRTISRVGKKGLLRVRKTRSPVERFQKGRRVKKGRVEQTSMKGEKKGSPLMSASVWQFVDCACLVSATKHPKT